MTLASRTVGAVLGLSLGVIGAASASAAPAFFVNADLVRGAEGQPQGAVCVPNTMFKQGESIVIRTEVFDSATGNALTADDIKNRWVHVYAHLGDQTVELHYGVHPPQIPGQPTPPKQESYWTTHWVIPSDFAAGTYNWNVTVNDAQGESATFTPIGSTVGLGSFVILPNAPQK